MDGGVRISRCRAAIGQAASQTNLDLLLGTTTAAEALNRVLTVVDLDPDVLRAAARLFPVGANQILGPLELTLTEMITDHSRRLVASDLAYAPDLGTSLINLSLAARREPDATSDSHTPFGTSPIGSDQAYRQATPSNE